MPVGAIVGIVVLVLLVIFLYNNLVGKKNRVEGSLSTIETYLQKRFDLLGSLFEQLERHLDHESQVYADIAKNRTGFDELRKAYDINKANSPSAIVEADRGISSMFKGMRMTQEQYPELKSIESVTKVMNETVTVENELNASRRQYNSNVVAYRNSIQTFPNIILAGMFGFKDIYELYKADEEAQSRPKTASADYYNAKYTKKIKDLESQDKE